MFKFSSLYRVLTIKNLTNAAILSHSSFFSWNLDFYRNLTKLEIEDLERLMLSIPHLCALVSIHPKC